MIIVPYVFWYIYICLLENVLFKTFASFLVGLFIFLLLSCNIYLMWYTHTHTQVYIHRHTHTHTHTYMYVCMYVFSQYNSLLFQPQGLSSLSSGGGQLAINSLSFCLSSFTWRKVFGWQFFSSSCGKCHATALGLHVSRGEFSYLIITVQQKLTEHCKSN